MQQQPVRAEFCVTEAFRVGRGDDQFAARGQQPAAFAEQADRVIDLLNQMAHQDQIERGVRKVKVFDRAEMNFQTFAPRVLDRLRIEIDALGRPAETRCLLEHRPVAASDVEESSRGTIHQIAQRKVHRLSARGCQVNRQREQHRQPRLGSDTISTSAVSAADKFRQQAQSMPRLGCRIPLVREVILVGDSYVFS